MRPKLSYYHPNGRGTGCAVQFELHPAHDMAEGSVWVAFAKQKTVGTITPMRTFPTFDMNNRIWIKLDMSDLMQMLQVFRGMQETIEDGKGLFHRTQEYYDIIKLEHRIEPVHGYVFEVSRKKCESEDAPERICIVFSVAEALGLSLAIEQSILYVAFGIPEVLK